MPCTALPALNRVRQEGRDVVERGGAAEYVNAAA